MNILIGIIVTVILICLVLIIGAVNELESQIKDR